jgi:hypothetical protein
MRWSQGVEVGNPWLVTTTSSTAKPVSPPSAFDAKATASSSVSRVGGRTRRTDGRSQRIRFLKIEDHHRGVSPAPDQSS